jgi:hypothetical protein
VRYLTYAEFTRLLAVLAVERRRWLTAAVYSGCRLSELEALRWKEHVDLDRGWLLIPGTKTRKSKRGVPMAPPLAELPEQVPEEERVGTVVAAWVNVRRDLEVACRHLGIERVTPNNLRRTFASWMKQRGVDSKAVADLMGHASTRMVDLVYGHLDEQALRNAIAALPAHAEAPRTGSKWVTDERDAPGQMGRMGRGAKLKAPQKAGLMVPRDRIELPTRGFSIPRRVWPTPRNANENRTKAGTVIPMLARSS